MRIGVLGWFGYCNAGDDRIAEVLTRRLESFHLTFLPSVPPPPEVANWFDAILLTGGSWHPRNGLAIEFHRWSRGVNVPILALGLGVESMTPELRAGSVALLRRCDMVWVRDEESRQLLGDSANIVVGPDLTWVDPYLAGKGGSTIALNLRPWSRVGWSPEDWVRAARGLGQEEKLEAWPLALADARLLGKFLGGVPDAFDPEIARCSRLVVSMRLHGLIFAAQMGVPAIGIRYDPKCERFLREIGRSDWLLPLAGSDELGVLASDVRRNEQEEWRRLEHLGAELTIRSRGLLDRAVEILHASIPRRKRSLGLPARGLTWMGRRLIRIGYGLKSH